MPEKKLLKMQIKDRACTICENNYTGNIIKAKSSKICEECIKSPNKKNWKILKELEKDYD